MPIKRRKDSLPLVALLFVALLFTGCRSTRREAVSPETVRLQTAVQQMQAMLPIDGCLSGKLKIEASLGEKSLSAGGTLGIEKGVGLQLAVTALGLFEVARLEATPEGLFIINKVGKEYASADYSASSLLGQAGLTYGILQSVLLNEPFMPGGDDFYASLSKMTLMREEGNIVAVTPEYDNMRYTFVFDASTGELRSSEGVSNGKVGVTCRYSGFKQLDRRSFPTKIDFEVQGTGTPIRLSLRLTNLKEGHFAFKRSSLSSYKKIDAKEIVKALDK